MIIKVCGMRNAENIKAVDNIEEVSLIGFIFHQLSSRYVSHVPSYLPQHSKRVGVFVNDDKMNICHLIRKFKLDCVQLHGNESPEYIMQLRKTFPKDNITIIKMIPISSKEDIISTNQYTGLVDYFLFETKTESYGGSGKHFDWDVLSEYKGDTPFLISGGIGPEDANKINSLCHPRFRGIDINSKFEVSPALKDVDMIRTFIKKLKTTS